MKKTLLLLAGLAMSAFAYAVDYQEGAPTSEWYTPYPTPGNIEKADFTYINIQRTSGNYLPEDANFTDLVTVTTPSGNTFNLTPTFGKRGEYVMRNVMRTDIPSDKITENGEYTFSFACEQIGLTNFYIKYNIASEVAAPDLPVIKIDGTVFTGDVYELTPNTPATLTLEVPAGVTAYYSWTVRDYSIAGTKPASTAGNYKEYTGPVEFYGVGEIGVRAYNGTKYSIEGGFNTTIKEEKPEAPAAPAIEIDGVAADGTYEFEEGSSVEVTFPAIEGADVYYMWTPAAGNALPANAAFVKYESPLTVDEAGTLQYYAANATDNTVVSETKSITFTVKETPKPSEDIPAAISSIEPTPDTYKALDNTEIVFNIEGLEYVQNSGNSVWGIITKPDGTTVELKPVTGSVSGKITFNVPANTFADNGTYNVSMNAVTGASLMHMTGGMYNFEIPAFSFKYEIEAAPVEPEIPEIITSIDPAPDTYKALDNTAIVLTVTGAYMVNNPKNVVMGTLTKPDGTTVDLVQGTAGRVDGKITFPVPAGTFAQGGTYKVEIKEATKDSEYTIYSNVGAVLTWPAFSFKYVIDTETGISGIAVENGNAVYFDLNGRRVANPENGIFIRIENNKAQKVLVK